MILNHAYGVSDILEFQDEFDDPKYLEGKIRLLRLRNPWGKSEWVGAWSDKSDEFAKYKYKVVEYVVNLPLDERFALDADDGTFFMNYDDWKDNMSTLLLNIDFPDHWTGVRFESAWLKGNSAGLP